MATSCVPRATPFPLLLDAHGGLVTACGSGGHHTVLRCGLFFSCFFRHRHFAAPPLVTGNENVQYSATSVPGRRRRPHVVRAQEVHRPAGRGQPIVLSRAGPRCLSHIKSDCVQVKGRDPGRRRPPSTPRAIPLTPSPFFAHYTPHLAKPTPRAPRLAPPQRLSLRLSQRPSLRRRPPPPGPSWG